MTPPSVIVKITAKNESQTTLQKFSFNFEMCTILFLGAFARWRLHVLYRKYPAVWKGNWQIELRETLAIFMLIGCALAIWKPVDPRGFVQTGIPFTLIAAAGLLIALLVIRRFGETRTAFSRWSTAFALLLFAAVFITSATIGEMILVRVIRGILGFY